MERTRQAIMYLDLFINRLTNIPNEVFGNRVGGAIDRFMNRIYNLL